MNLFDLLEEAELRLLCQIWHLESRLDELARRIEEFDQNSSDKKLTDLNPQD